LKRFDKFLDVEPDARKQWENIGLQLFVFFLYTYFCGAVYDDRIYSKMALAVESVRFIRELYLVRWLQKGYLKIEDYVELAYRYAREIEHSDVNLNDMEDFLENEK
jgi:lysine-N-methylase